MREKGLDPDFPKDALGQLARIEAPAREKDPAIRDQRDLLWASIDNDDSRDLDQLSVAEELAGGSVKVLVAIADVDAVVKKGTPLDARAEQNTTSVYTAGGVFPMLPEKLSTDLTSLNQDEDRLSVVVEYVVNADGTLGDSNVYRSLVRNKAKPAYDAVTAAAPWCGAARARARPPPISSSPSSIPRSPLPPPRRPNSPRQPSSHVRRQSPRSWFRSVPARPSRPATASRAHGSQLARRVEPAIFARASRLTAVSMDMTGGYAASVREHAPQATIVIDNHPVVQLATKALDEVRREHWNELRSTGETDAAKQFKHDRWALLKNPEDLSDRQAATLQALRAAGGKVVRAWAMKEMVRAIFAPGLAVEDVAELIDRLLARLSRSRLKPASGSDARSANTARGSSPPGA